MHLRWEITIDLSTRRDCRAEKEENAHIYLLKFTNEDSRKEITVISPRMIQNRVFSIKFNLYCDIQRQVLLDYFSRMVSFENGGKCHLLNLPLG